MSWSISEMASMIRLHSSGRSCGRGGRKTEPLTNPHKKMKMNHWCHLWNRSWHTAAGTGRNGSSAWRLQCHKGRTHRALMRYAKKKKNLESFSFHV
jgi:hypothetical protein